MRTTIVSCLLSCAVALGAATTPSAHAYDLTGTWVGKWSCKSFDGEKFNEGNRASTLKITQTGNTMNVDLDNNEFHYNGGAIPDTAKPEKGQGTFHECSTTNVPLQGDLNEMILISVKTKVGAVKATLKGVSVYDNVDTVGACKYSFKRTDGTNPNVGTCPP